MVGRYILTHPLDEELQVLEDKINHSFANGALLREALHLPNGWNGDGNKRLSLIGDPILKLVIGISGRNENNTIGKRFTLATLIYFTSWTYDFGSD